MNYNGLQLNIVTKSFEKNYISNETSDSLWELTQQALAIMASLLTLPLLLVLWIAVKSTSQGSFLFCQKRPGLNGKIFTIYKIRTMTVGSDKNNALGVTNDNPSVTKVGRFLRASKLDELPQLWNIARGDMNFVGPRPIPVALHNKLSQEIAHFDLRYKIKPGLTSIGQVCIYDNELGDSLISDWKTRFEGELHLMRNKSFYYDIVLLFISALYFIKKIATFQSNPKQ